MSKNDLNDAINNFAKSVPRLQDQFANTNRAFQKLAKPVDLGDPDKFAPNRTANNTEKMVEPYFRKQLNQYEKYQKLNNAP